MKRQKNLQKVVFGYISFAFVALVADLVWHPLPLFFAAVWLLVACYYLGKYGDLTKTK